MEAKITKKIVKEDKNDNDDIDDIDNEDNENIELNLLMINQGWNEQNERLIVGVGYNAGIYKELHQDAASRFSIYDNILNFSIILLSVFLSTNSILNLTSDSGTSSYIKNIVVFVITILTVSNNFLKYQQLSLEHKQASTEFNQIYNDIRNTMCIYRKDRTNAVKYIQMMMKKYDQLEVKSPRIPNNLLVKMDKKIKEDAKLEKANIKMPNDKLQEIEIVIDKPAESKSTVQEATYNDNDNFRVGNKQNLKDMQKIFGVTREGIEPAIRHIEQTKGRSLQTAYEMNRLINSNNFD